MKIAVAGSRTSQRWRTIDMDWPELLDRLRNPTRTEETTAEYRAMTKDEQSARKDVGGFVGGALRGRVRKKGEVTGRWLVTLDADDANLDELENWECLYGYRSAVYSTHSHTPEHPRLRWVIALDRAVTPDEYEAIARKMAEWIGIGSIDPSSYQPERLMYWPSCPRDAEFYYREFDGEVARAADLLGEYGPGEAWRDTSLWPIGDSEVAVIRREMGKQADPTSKKGIVGAFCRSFSVPDAIDEFELPYEECATPGRYTYTEGSTAAGAVLYENGLWLYSNHATDPACGMLLNAFDLVRVHKFGQMDEGKPADTPMDKRPSFRAMCEFAAGLPAIKRKIVEDRVTESAADFADMVTSGAADAQNGAFAVKGADAAPAKMPEETNPEWADELAVNRKTGEPDSTISNAVLILRHDPALRGAVAKNLFTSRVVARRALPWRPWTPDSKGQDNWTDADDSNLFLYMEQTWGYVGEPKIRHALSIVTEEFAFHPIRDYLNSLPEWDGVERADTVLCRHMGADDTRYTRAVTRKWLCAAIARVLWPGCKFDNMLMLFGTQGAGKSQFGQILSRGWASNSMTSMGGKDAYDGVRAAWIIEVAELAAAKKSEVDEVKNFVSAQVDTYRPAYARNVMDFPRQCVFYGTTNDAEFLRDTTGGRRFWPVRVQRVDGGRLSKLPAEVDQIWAEALYRLRAGEELWLTDEALYKEAAQVQAMVTVEDENLGRLEDFLDAPVPDCWDALTVAEKVDWFKGRSILNGNPTVNCVTRNLICIAEIQDELFDGAAVGGNRVSGGRYVASLLAQLPGWRKLPSRKRRPAYGAQWCYARVGSEADHENDEEANEG